MTLVQVTDLDRGGERLDNPPAGHPENDLLRDADFAPGIVKFARDAAVGRAVERVVGVEQVQFDAPDQSLPHAQRDGPPGQVESDAEPGSVRALRRLDRQRTRVVKWISLVLHPGGVDDLPEIALLIKETHADYGYPEIARRFDEAAGEDAEPSGIERQPFAEAELHAEIGDSRKGGSAVRGGEPPRRIEIGLPSSREPFELRHERIVGGERPQPLCGDVLKDDPRVSGAAPSLRIDSFP
jgi:hypothetical protein